MRFAFEIGINALEAFLILFFLARYFGYRVGKSVCIVGSMVMWCLSWASISYFSWNSGYENVSTLMQIGINFIFCIWLLKGNVWTKAFMSVFTMGCVLFIASFTAFLFGRIFHVPLEVLFVQFGSSRVIAVLTSKVLFFQVIELLLHLKQEWRINADDFISLIALPFFVISIVIVITYAAIRVPQIQQSAFYLVCVLFAFDILIYYVFTRLARNRKEKQEYKLLALQYENTIRNAQDIQRLYSDVRALRHDMANHLLCLSQILQDQENGQNEAKKYVQHLLKQQEQVQHVIIFSGNDALDAIVNVKMAAAEQRGLTVEIAIGDPLYFVEAEDICVLLGNLLDNAIDAAQKTKERMIWLRIQRQEDYVLIHIKNSIAATVLQNNPLLQTTKAQKLVHGVGIKNIKCIVKKYKGMIDFFEEDQCFVCEMILTVAQKMS